jgi:cytochrome P450
MGRVVVASSPSAIRDVMIAKAGNYPRETLQRRILSDGLGFGLLAAEGEQWRRQRAAIVRVFSAENLAASETAIAGAAEATVARWRQLHDGDAIPLDREITAFTIRTLENTLFPDGLGDEGPRFGEALQTYFRDAGKPGLADLIPCMRKLPRWGALRSRNSLGLVRSIAATAQERWKNRKRNPGGISLLDSIGQPGGQPPALDRQEVDDNTKTFIATGFETGAGTLCWAIYLLAMDADWRRRVESEIDSVMPDGRYRAGMLERLVSVRAVVDETLRLYPTVAVTARQAIAADSLDGVRVRPGDIVVISPWLVNRHRRNWPDPDVFDPSRFLHLAGTKVRNLAYIPFGAGPRACIGQRLALQQLVISLAVFMRAFRFVPADGFRIWPHHCVTMQPVGNLAMRLFARS